MDKKNLKNNNLFSKQINYFFYRRKHLIFYILIGILSIFIENIIRNLLISQNLSFLVSSIISLIIGIVIAFLLNFFFNFNVPRYFFYRSLLYFFIISIISFNIQSLANLYFNILFLSYDNSRFIYSGFFFLIGYFLHVQLSFKQKRKVGVALYLNSENKPSDIYAKIGPYPDFIHIDIVENNKTNKYSIKEFVHYWPNHKLDLHIMSKHPLKFINEKNKNLDVIYFHYEIEDNINSVINEIIKLGAKPGIVLHAINDYKNLDKIIKKFKFVLILSIDKVGHSGQIFLNQAESLINRVNKLKYRSSFELCVDGGITIENINNINCEKIVSASNILNSTNPKRKIMGLQTLSRYEKKQFKN